jgi:glutathione S-transferase
LSAVDIMMSFPAEVAVRQGRGDRHPRLEDFVTEMHERPAFKRALERGGDYAFA